MPVCVLIQCRAISVGVLGTSSARACIVMDPQAPAAGVAITSGPDVSNEASAAAAAEVITDNAAGGGAAAAPAQLRGRPRGRPTHRPKIDIDGEVDEANRLADLFRRLQKAAKNSGRAAMKSKQRLMKKANKLSEMDLMRLAVLKRCGFIDVQRPEEVVDGQVAAGAAAALPNQPGGQNMGKRLMGMVSNIPGANELLKSLESPDPSSSSTAASSASATGTVSQSGTSLPTRCALGLKRLPRGALALAARGRKRQRGRPVKVPVELENGEGGADEDSEADDSHTEE